MAKTKLPTMKRKLRRVAVLLILFIAVTNFLYLSFDIADDDGAPGPNNLRQPRASAVDDAALAHIPRRVVDTWSRREYLIVLGIISMDNEERRTRRNLQRSTCCGSRSGDEGERLHRCDACAVRLWATPVARLRILCRAAGGGVAVERCGCAANERGSCDD
ncbi:putative UDP-Gal or UDP-GlcNAc-dependent glycosyltransferase [Trypanosoma cruzi]|uniref:Putative UDP-Gal or UDP-GlcNAc-dependent glycosyltransferase n=1 Tax=Trypanosoma cruzi TaxID=5693 RepID=A0A2V2ULH7_TRYCR|nr:putative UDP-Gal or UDP-GlcNAc-dependent glycosyltransferase [Trypanosoma cruzi]